MWTNASHVSCTSLSTCPFDEHLNLSLDEEYTFTPQTQTLISTEQMKWRFDVRVRPISGCWLLVVEVHRRSCKYVPLVCIIILALLK